MKKTLIILLCLISVILLQANDSKITKYVLDNGLTVIINEDHSQPTVFGCVVVRAGSKDDPDDATGLAHYMEHVMFKGTQDLGTSDWEAEKPHYEKIVSLYEDLRNTSDPTQKEEINKEINKESLEAGKYAIPNEFANLVQAIGGTGLNAATGKDYTYYFNSFPPFQVQRWLDLYSHRFINPVFRGFQAELENVYEEKNKYSDNPYQAVINDFFAQSFDEKNPYGRLIVGTTNDLKNPSIKRITEFYNLFYVPSNMALILSGDINPENIKPLIENSFGKWEKKELQTTPRHSDNLVINKPIKIKRKFTPTPLLMLGYPAVETNNPDELAFEFCSRLLSNSNETGLLDKLVLDGDLTEATSVFYQFKYAGMVIIQAIPVFDRYQMNFTPLSETEKIINDEIEKLKKGEFEGWLIDAFKNEMIREYDQLFESPVSMGTTLMSLYANETDFNKFFNYKERVQKITKDDIIRVANKYFTEKHISYFSEVGKPDKDNLEKPKFETIDPIPGKKSKYSTYFETLPLSEVKEQFVDFNKDIQISNLADKVKLYYVPNKTNNIFSLVLKFGIGTGKMPTLDLATQLMNYAGIMAQFKPQELKMEYSKLGCSVRFYNTESNLIIYMEGNEDKLGDACQLLSRTFLMPALDDKQMNNVIGSELSSRITEKKEKDYQANALLDYIIYGDNSAELNRISTTDLQELTIKELTGTFIEATHYEASVHYVGKLPFEQVINILKNSLALPSFLKDSESPYIRPIVEKNKEEIYFFNNPDARQSEIYFYTPCSNYNLDEEPVINAFNQYFSGGFNGLVMQELREKRSLAYTAYAQYVTPAAINNKSYLIGYIGTQADKTSNAVIDFMKLIKEMPEKPERMDNIKKYLIQSSQASKPGFRSLSQTVENWQKKGYTDDPDKLLIPKYESITYNGLKEFYQNEIATKPISIVIVGNKKEIDMDKLESVAKIVKINSNKIFKD